MKKFIDIDYNDTDEANKLFTFILGERSNGKCAVEKQLLKQAKIIKDLKKELNAMYGSSVSELNRVDNKVDKAFIRGYQDAVSTVMWLIYKGEHYEN